MTRARWRLSVRERLLAALAALAVAVLCVGLIAWGALTRGNDRLDRLLGETVSGVERALTLSRKAADLATLAPYLLTLDSPFRITQEGEQATDLVRALSDGLPPDHALQQDLAQTEDAIAALVRDSSARAELRDRTLRLTAELAALERDFATLSAQPDATLAERQRGLSLQSVAAALLGAGRAENLIGVGEFQREYVRLTRPMTTLRDDPGLARLRQVAERRDGLFELRRLELARQIGAEAALVRIRQGAAAVTAHAGAVTQDAQALIAAERASTATAIAVAKSTLLAVVFASAVLALTAALYVSGYVTANLRAISDAMMRLAVGDRQARLPRGEGQGDEIGKLFYAFRAFRANALRLDRSHRQMAQRTALYENMMTGISDGVAILSDQGQIVAHNGRLAPLLRVDPSRLSTRPRLQDLVSNAGWHSSDGPAGLSSLSLASDAVIELRESALPGGGTVVLISDATERRQMEDRLRQIQRIEALGKVSGEVAHDFGNILSTIAGNLHMMDTASPARQAALLQSIGVAVDLGASLTGRLLAFARRQHLEPETVDLPQLIEGLADLVGFALRDEIELDISTGAHPLPVRVDPGQMESAILNLCLNAGQAIAGPGRISVGVRQCGTKAVIEVSDTGAGMAPEVLAHAMEPFFSARADGTGTGLGLAMVYGFIRQSGGDVQISSTLGQGTSVRLSLPLCTSPETLPTLGRVVLVEDDLRDRAASQEVLAQMSKTLNVAPDVRVAIALLDQPVDLFVTDLSLNGQIEGWRLAKAALARWPDAKALVVSGHLPQSNPLVAQFPGRIATLPKPLTTDAMRHALASLSPKAQRHDAPAQP